VAQENSHQAIASALQSFSPNIEVDLIHFINEKGDTVGLLAHEYEMKRTTGMKGKFFDQKDISRLRNTANPNLPPEPFITVIDLFELIKKVKAEQNIIPLVSLDLNEESDRGEEFGAWLGGKIREYGFQAHAFASSFYASNIIGVEKTCPECLTGGLVFKDHWLLRYLDYTCTSLDLAQNSIFANLLPFVAMKMFPHDFVLVQDDILFAQPELMEYWRNNRKVKFVGVFVYEKERGYTDAEWQILNKADWLELDPLQMRQYEKYKNTK